MVREVYQCEQCKKLFDERAEAEEHENIPLVSVPMGFIYKQSPFSDSSNLFCIVSKPVRVDAEHFRVYRQVVFNGPEKGYREYYERSPHGILTANTEKILDSFRDGRSGFSYMTELEAERFLSQRDVPRRLRWKGIKSLVLDLEGTKKIPVSL